MTHLISGIVALVAGLVIMPNGPLVREVFAILLIALSTVHLLIFVTTAKKKADVHPHS